MAKLIVAFRNFVNAPQNCHIILVLAVITFILRISTVATTLDRELLHHINNLL